MSDMDDRDLFGDDDFVDHLDDSLDYWEFDSPEPDEVEDE